jgi:glycosyltransferase involved in cell wall biosynthesis
MKNSKKIIISHPMGNMNTRAAAIGLRKKGLLYKFYTCIACFENSLLYKLASLPFLKEFRRRLFDSSLEKVTHTFPWRELGRQISIKFKFKHLLKHEKGYFCVDKICRNFDKQVSRDIKNDNINAVYAYEDCALLTFRAAKKQNKYCIYDLPIGYWRSMRYLLSIEQERNPQWAITLGGFNDSDEKLKRKDEELSLADKIYVASTFTKKTLELYPGKLSEIEVIPYGFPSVNKQREYKAFNGRKIKVLFVGGLSQRKGISYLFDAIKGLEDKLELTVVGRGNIDSCPILKQELQKVNYIPSLPHDAILKLMAEHDLFIFPSLFEGFGLVITEAMSQGTPVITTERTCGPDIITNGKDGWIVEAGNHIPIKELLKKIIEQPTILHKVGHNALHTASLRPWECYEEELATSVEDFINNIE